ncbi:MAG: Gldg family protein [Candidatus Coatesbacteria bacterium]
MNALKPWSRALGIAGAVLLGLWVVLGAVLAAPAWSLWATGGPGLLLAAGWVALEWTLVRTAVLSPGLRYGSNALLFTGAVVIAVALVNVITTRHSWRTDLTSNRFFSLSEQTRQIVKGLNRKVKLTVFVGARNTESGELRDLLELYGHASRQLDIEYVDPDLKPERAYIYKITGQPTVVVESAGKRKDILPQEMFGYQFNGQQPQREFKGEPVLTAAILSVASDQQSVIYFVEGHGERSIMDTTDNGIASLKAGLERDNFVVKTLNILKDGKIPADADLLIVAGPSRAFPAPEQKVLAEWLAKSGRLLVLLDNVSPPGLDAILKPWGVKPLAGLAVDPRSNYPFAGPMVPAPLYESHKITADLSKQGVAVILPGARALELGTVPGGTVLPLLKTTDASWLEADWQTEKTPKFTSGTDRRGPLTLAAAIAVAAPLTATAAGAGAEPASLPPHSPKIVVFGNTTFVTNGLRGTIETGFDLFANAVNWLSGSTESISIRPKQRDDRRIFLDNVKTNIMFTVSLIVFPLGVILVGVWTWWRRRSL